MERPSRSNARAAEWRHGLLVTVAGLLVFETLTGLSLYLLPFSVPNQWMVLLHTGVGLLFTVPYGWYQLRHWWMYRRMPLSHVVLTGYFAMAATVAATVSGLVLTYQAVFATRISYGWDLVHVVSTFALVAAALPHVLVLVVRNVRARKAGAVRAMVAAQRVFGVASSYVVLGLFALVVLGVYAYTPVPLQNALPADYNYLYGPDRPFAPSLARTSTNQAFDARTMGGSASCGRSGCHLEIYREWEVSAHRWAAMDPAFRAVQTVMGEQNGPESTRYCGGCHDPISLFAGAKNLYRQELTNPMGFDEGVSCVVCHAIQETDVKGNAAYTIRQPERYLFELHDGKAAQAVSDFLIRAYPQQHVESLQHKLFKSPEFCAACHKQFIDEEINNVGWVQLQNQYDNWRKSRWNHPGEPEKTIECRECHMPLQPSFDPASGDDLDYNRAKDDGKHRSHRFLGANQYIPTALSLPGGEEQVRLIEAWLRGDLEVPEIADKWKAGPAVPVELVAPDRVVPGEAVKLDVVITNNKVGHDFPTGPLDIIQSWVELVVTDQDGRAVFTSGRRDDRHFIAPGSFMFKAEPVDQYGNLIDRHNLWEMVGVRFRRSLFPGFSDRAQYAFACPGTAGGTGQALPGRQTFTFDAPGRPVTALKVEAKLLYRKVDQFLLNELFGADAGLTTPVTVISSDAATIEVGTPPAATP